MSVQKAVVMQVGNGDDLIRIPRRRVARIPIPPFPREDFYALLQLAWDEGFPTDRSLNDNRSDFAYGPRVPYAALEHAPYAAVWNAVQGAFFVYRKQHGMKAGHVLCWLAVEFGLIRTTDRMGRPRYDWWRPDVAGAVMTTPECARYYGYTVGTVNQYLREAWVAVDDEWADVWLIGNHG